MRFLALLIALFAAPAFAETSSPEAAQIDLARRHFQSGSAYFEEARYEEAAREFRESYRLAPRVDLLYNIARCYQNKNDAARALEFYRRYLEEKPNARDRVPIERTIADLSPHVGRVKVENAPPGSEVTIGGWSFGTAPLAGPVVVTAGKARVEARLADGSVRAVEVSVQPEEEVTAKIPGERVIERVVERRSPKWWDSKPGWAVTGAGVLLLAGGLVLALPVADSVGAGGKDATSETAWRATKSNHDTLQNVGLVAALAGAVGIGVGVTLFGLKYRHEAARVSVMVTPGGAGLFARGTF